MNWYKFAQRKAEEEELIGKNKEYQEGMTGYKYVDGIEAFGMEMYLLYSDHYPEGFNYHLAFQRTGTKVLDGVSMFDRPKNQNPNAIMMFKSMKPLIKKLSEWISIHGPLCIASSNNSLKVKWINALMVASRFVGINFKIEKKLVEVYGGMARTELYLISK